MFLGEEEPPEAEMRESMKNMQDYDEALSSGGKENKLYTYNKWKKIICQ